MQICVCGWYYHPEFYRTLSEASDQYDIMVIAHRGGHTSGLPCVSRENIGLEWGAYAFFLEHHWDDKSDVLFMHDDTELRLEFLSEASSISHDLAFVFEDEEDFRDSYTHGRVFFASARFLHLVRSQAGIWYDRGNKGFITGRARTEKPPAGCRDHNAGIKAFTSQAEQIGKQHPSFSVNRPVFSQNIRYGIRGELRNKRPNKAIEAIGDPGSPQPHG